MVDMRKRGTGSGGAGAERRTPDARSYVLAACAACSLAAFTGGWLVGARHAAAPPAAHTQTWALPDASTASAASTVVLPIQRAPDDPRELIPLPGDQPVPAIPEECLPFLEDGAFPDVAPFGDGPDGPRELIPLEPAPRPGGPAPPPPPRDPPGTLRADGGTRAPPHTPTPPGGTG